MTHYSHQHPLTDMFVGISFMTTHQQFNKTGTMHCKMDYQSKGYFMMQDYLLKLLGRNMQYAVNMCRIEVELMVTKVLLSGHLCE